MAIQIEGNQIQNGVISFAKLAAADIETTLTGSSSKLARADAIKSYIDNVAAGIHWKDSVKCATTGNITLSGEQTIDGITTSGSRVLVRAQTSAAQNGIYVSASGAWSRASDMDQSSEFAGAAVFVREGTTYADVGFVCTNDADPNVGTDDIDFTQFTGAATLVAGDGLTKTGNTFDVNVDDSSIEISADALQVKALGISADMLAGGIGNAKLSNSTISGVALGGNLNALSVVTGSALAMTSYNGSAARSDLSVQVDDSSIQISSNALQVKAAGITNAMLAGNITADRLATGAGLDDNAGALEVQVDDSTIEIDGVSGNLRVKDSGVTNAKLANSTISGISLGSNLNALSVVSGSALSMTSYNGSAARSDLAVQVDDSSIEINSNALRLKDGGIQTSKLNNGAVTSDKLADDAVTAAKVGFASNWDVLSPDGSATTFDLSETVNDAFAMLIVVRNGVVLKQVMSSPSGQDEYSVSLTGGAGGVTRLTFGSAVTNGADLRAWYMA